MYISKKFDKPGFTIFRLSEEEMETRCRHDIEITFNVIDTTIDPADMFEDMGLINGDIYDICQGIVDRAIVLCDWSNHAFDECLEMVQDYIYTDYEHEEIGHCIGSDKYAFFFIIDKDNDFNWKHIGIAAQHGYMTADQILDLSGNFAMVKTTLDTYRKMNEKYVLLQQNIRRFKYNAKEDCYEERK